MQIKSRQTAMFIDLQSLDLGIEAFSPDNLCFDSRTYKLLSGTTVSMSTFERAFKPLNSFLSSMDRGKQTALANFFADTRSALNREVSNTSKDTMIDTLSSYFSQIATDITLIDKLRKFVKYSEIHLPQKSTSLSDTKTEAMIFTHNEYVDLAITSLICKLLSPVWGEFIHRTKKYVAPVDKERYCLGMITKFLLDSELGRTTDLLAYYISAVVDRRIIKEPNCKLKSDDLKQHIRAVLYVKRLVTFDLCKENSDIMKYIATCTEKHLVRRISGP